MAIVGTFKQVTLPNGNSYQISALGNSGYFATLPTLSSNATLATQEWTNTTLGSYLPLTAGQSYPLSGTLFSNVNDINFVGTQGKIGFRAYKPNTTTNAGQMLITSDGTVANSYRLSVQAYNATIDGYETLRLGDTEGLTYKSGSNVALHVDKNGNCEVANTVQIKSKVSLQYNSTDDCLEFVFI